MPPRSAIGATPSLPRVTAMVSSPNPQPPLTLRGENRRSAPKLQFLGRETNR